MKLNPWKISTLLLALALALSIGLPAIQSADAHKVAQPHMEAGLVATRTAIRQLDKAAPNKAGHRVAAIGLLKQAEAQILKGIEAGGAHTH